MPERFVALGADNAVADVLGQTLVSVLDRLAQPDAGASRDRLGHRSAPHTYVEAPPAAVDHAHSFGRIELVIYDGPNDETGKRLDLVDESVRAKVAGVTTHEHLRQLFNHS